MIWFDLVRSTTFWYDLVRFGTIWPILSGTVRAYQNTCEHIRAIGVSYRELSPAEITNTSQVLIACCHDHLPRQSQGKRLRLIRLIF